MQQQLEPPTQMALASGHMVEELFVVLRGLRRGWYYIAISAVICLALGLVYAFRAKTTYQAMARLLILEQGGRLLPGPNGVPFQGGGAERQFALDARPHPPQPECGRAGDREDRQDQRADRRCRSSTASTVTIPDATAKVLQLAYTAGTKEEAKRVMDAVIASYREVPRIQL